MVSLLGTEQQALISAKIGQRYDLLVSLPDGTSGQSYPVLYILDSWHFPPMAFLQNNNTYSKRMRRDVVNKVAVLAGERYVVPRRVSTLPWR